MFNTEYDWAYSTAPEAALGGRELFWPRGKTLGGSSSLNAQMYVRGNRADYDGWAALGNTGWGYDDVLPYFVRSETNTHGASPYHGDRGTLTVSDLRDPNPLSSVFVDAAVEAGIKRNDDINGAEQDGVGLSHVTQTRGSRCSTADAFLKPIRKRANLTVVTGAHVTRVVLDGTRAVGVEYSVDGVTQTADASPRGDPQRRSDQLAAAAHALGHRPGRRTCATTASTSCVTFRASAATCRTTCRCR